MITNASAMVESKDPRQKSRNEVLCNYYHKRGNLREKCHKLICFLPHFKTNKPRVANANKTVSMSKVAGHLNTSKEEQNSYCKLDSLYEQSRTK